MKFAKVLAKIVAQKNLNSSQPLKVIVFCDPGIDNALMLLQVLSAKRLDVVAIVPAAGNVAREQTLDNILRICEWVGRTDIKVYPGCLCPEGKTTETMLNGLAVYSDNGLGGITLPPVQHLQAQTQDGVAFAAEVLVKQPLLIISTGGLTDIYRLLKQLAANPTAMNNLLGISMMAGVINASQEANAPIAVQRRSEFNILFDPMASQGIFELTAKYAIPLFLAPLDLTHQLLCSETDAQLFKNSQQLAVQLAYQLLHQVPVHYQARYGLGPDGHSRQPLHDVHASACVLHPELYSSQLATVSINEIGTISVDLNQTGNVHLLNLPYWHRANFFQALRNDLQPNLVQKVAQRPKVLPPSDLLTKPQLLVWDLDDTLWDCLWHYRKLINATRSHYGLTHWSHEEFNAFGYVHRQHMFEHMFTTDNAQAALQHFYQLFEAKMPESTDAKLFASTLKVLENLKQQNIPMIAISNTENRLVQKLMKHFQLDPYFKKVVGSQGHTVQWQDLKPNAQIFEQLMHELALKHLPRESIWFIGDSLSSDIRCAKNANAMGIFYCPPHRALPKEFSVQPDHIIHDLEQLIDLIDIAEKPRASLNNTAAYEQFGLLATKSNTHHSTQQAAKPQTSHAYFTNNL